MFAFIGLLWQVATLVFIYHRFRDYPPRNGTDHAFINAPFSIYTAYSLFIVLWQVFQFSDHTKHSQIVRNNTSHHILLTRIKKKAHVFIILFIGFIALHLVDYSHRKDWVYSLTTAWYNSDRMLRIKIIIMFFLGFFWVLLYSLMMLHTLFHLS